MAVSHSYHFIPEHKSCWFFGRSFLRHLTAFFVGMGKGKDRQNKIHIPQEHRRPCRDPYWCMSSACRSPGHARFVRRHSAPSSFRMWILRRPRCMSRTSVTKFAYAQYGQRGWRDPRRDEEGGCKGGTRGLTGSQTDPPSIQI